MGPGMSQLDVASSLAEVVAEYRRLEAENARLRMELERARRRGGDESPQARTKSQFQSWDSEVAARHMFHSASNFDDVGIFSAKINADRASLQQLVTDLDPDEQGAWAKVELTAASCLEAVRAHGKYEHTEESLQEIVDNFRAHISDTDAAPTQLQLVDVSSVAQITEVFGAERVEMVMELQDALQWSMKNRVIAESFEHEAPGAAPSRVRELWEIFRPTTPLAWVETAGVSLVVVNVLLLGVSSDVHPLWGGWDVISSVLAVLFIGELLARIYLSGGFRAFFGSKNRGWNIFETVVVLITLLDLFVLLYDSQGEAGARTTMACRVIRLLRLTRITRLARTGIFHELTYMLRGIESGRSTLVWGFFLIVLICYIFAVALSQTIGRAAGSEGRPVIDVHFRSIPSSMFTLFSCFTGNCAAYDGRPLGFILYEYYGPLMVLIYMLMFFLVSFGLFNVLVASFLQSSMRASRFSDVERRRVLKKERKMVRQKTSLLLDMILQHCLKRRDISSIDAEAALKDIRISRSMYTQLLRDPEIQQWLEDMGCEDSLRSKLFDKIDRDGNGVLECTELVTGIVDLLRGRIDNMEALMSLVRSVDRRLMELEAFFVMTHHAAGAESVGLLASI